MYEHVIRPFLLRTSPLALGLGLVAVLGVLLAIVVIADMNGRAEYKSRCFAAGGTTATFERYDTACWTADGRRLFP